MEYKRTQQPGINFPSTFSVEVRHIRNKSYYFNLPYFNETKKVAALVNFTYEGDKEKLENLIESINKLEPEIDKNNLRKEYTDKSFSLNETKNVLRGKIEIHFFQPISKNPLLKESEISEESLQTLPPAVMLKEVNKVYLNLFDLFIPKTLN